MAFPPRVDVQLPGWSLFWAHLQATSQGADRLARLREEVAQRLRASLTQAELPQHPTVAAIRKLFRRAGCDPTRWRPSSEALARRLLRGEDLPALLPLVDLNNCLSVELLVPACVVAAEAVGSSWVLRVGDGGETMLSLRGPVSLAGKPLLADEHGPASTPITDAQRVAVRPQTREAWLVLYLPAGLVGEACALSALTALLAEAPVAEVRATAFFPGFS